LALLLAIPGGVCLLPALYLTGFLLAGQPQPERREIGPGVTYERRTWTQPRKNVAHIAQIDLTLGHRFALPAPVQTPEGWQNRAQTASEVMRDLGADLVVNASFFTPFRDAHLFDYFPHSGDFVQLTGTTISRGQRYGKQRPGGVTFWCDANGGVGFGDPPQSTICAVTGRQWLLRNGAATPQDILRIEPRTVLGVDAARHRLWLVVVDGRQPNYSIGMTYTDLQPLLLELGATDAIELDGGGSSTMVVRGNNGAPFLLNRPCHTKIPMRERPVASCLGVLYPATRE
jgi:hypothetical protein